jgi:N utilization substance protein B
MDPRHFKRVKIVQEVYSFFFNPTEAKHKKTLGVIENEARIDELIVLSAPKYSIDRISKVDVAILRVAIYELVFEKKEPVKVIINEAVEIAKEMSGEKSPGFINAVLGKVIEIEHVQLDES